MEVPKDPDFTVMTCVPTGVDVDVLNVPSICVLVIAPSEIATPGEGAFEYHMFTVPFDKLLPVIVNAALLLTPIEAGEIDVMRAALDRTLRLTVFELIPDVPPLTMT